MNVHFVGSSFAPKHLAAAAEKKGFSLTQEVSAADVVFVSQDTPTDSAGVRDLAVIRNMVLQTYNHIAPLTPLVLTSQVPPGFTRSLDLPIYYQAETLRVTQDTEERALRPEQHIVGCETPELKLAPAYQQYLEAFDAPILKMTWEDAEFAKMAINAFLAAQVDMTNHLAMLAGKCGAKWERIAEVLRHDRRIGPHAYLTPGRWENSLHLVRDIKTLIEIERK